MLKVILYFLIKSDCHWRKSLKTNKCMSCLPYVSYCFLWLVKLQIEQNIDHACHSAKKKSLNIFLSFQQYKYLLIQKYKMYLRLIPLWHDVNDDRLKIWLDDVDWVSIGNNYLRYFYLHSSIIKCNYFIDIKNLHFASKSFINGWPGIYFYDKRRHMVTGRKRQTCFPTV